jgi:hypothetical protein
VDDFFLSVQRMCDIVLNNVLGNKELEAIALYVGHDDRVLNAARQDKGSAEQTAHNTSSPKCEQCEHFDLSQSVYTVECYSCKRYFGDLFTLRAGA